MRVLQLSPMINSSSEFILSVKIILTILNINSIKDIYYIKLDCKLLKKFVIQLHYNNFK